MAIHSWAIEYINLLFFVMMYHSVLMMDFKLTPCTLRYVVEISILAVFTTLWHLLVDSYLPNGRHSHSIHVYVEFYAYKGSKLMLAHEHFCQGQLMGNMFGRAGFKYVFSNTNTNTSTNTSFHIFSCDQAALQMVFSVCLSVCPSVRPSVRLSVTPFSPCSHHRIIMKFSGVITMVKSDVHAKGQGQR